MTGLKRSVAVPLIALLAVAAVAFAVWPRGETMYVRMPVAMYRDSAPEELAALDELDGGQRVIVLERRPPWARVKIASSQGWLPEWYLVNRQDQVLPAVQPEQLVVKDPCHVYLYPETAAPAIRDLEAGKVVAVKAGIGDWRYVDIIVYDIPGIARGWMKAEDLAAPGEVAPREGRLPAGTVVYPGDPSASEPGRLPQQVLSYEMTVSVRAGVERGDMVYVTAAGGWEAWVAKADIVFVGGK